MLPDLPTPIVLLLHEGGWDEVLMVAVALGIAYFVIVWSGRRHQNDEEDAWDEDDASGADPPEATSDQPPRHRS